MKQEILLTSLAPVFIVCQTGAQLQTSNIVAVELPLRYFKLLEAGVSRVEKQLATEPEATLASLESQPGWKHFPNAILMPAVLFAKSHPVNKQYGNVRMLQLAQRIGDLLVTEYDKGHYTARGDNDWDTYMWLEAYRLLENKLGEERQERWKLILLKEIGLLEPKLAKCQDYPWYNAPFIITSPNHYSIYASTLLVAGHVFDKPEWVKLSTKVLHRFCAAEQTGMDIVSRSQKPGSPFQHGKAGHYFMPLTRYLNKWVVPFSIREKMRK